MPGIIAHLHISEGAIFVPLVVTLLWWGFRMQRRLQELPIRSHPLIPAVGATHH
jgi:hypothetical protein